MLSPACAVQCKPTTRWVSVAVSHGRQAWAYGCGSALTCPRAGPTGGDGFAWPALMTCTHAAAVSARCQRKDTFTGDGDDGLEVAPGQVKRRQTLTYQPDGSGHLLRSRCHGQGGVTERPGASLVAERPPPSRQTSSQPASLTAASFLADNPEQTHGVYKRLCRVRSAHLCP